jgi:ribonuclease P protein component
MLPRNQRLTRQADIVAVLRGGKRYRSEAVQVYVKSSQDSRLACVVGKKVSPLATVRHRYQRWLRVIGREIVAQSPQADIVVVAQPAIKKYQDLKTLRQEVLGNKKFTP